MCVRYGFTKLAFAALAVTCVVTPAMADTKAGVDAWSRGEYETAVNEWRPSAVDGDADAQFNLGQAYKLGRGVKTDLDVALGWYRKAAAQGHLQAADSCGHLLHYQQKIPEALPFLIASSDRGEPRAQYLLATELFNGVYIEKDWVRAYALMTRAASSGMASASRSLSQMDQYIPIEQRQAGTSLAAELEQRVDRIAAAPAPGVPVDTSPARRNIAPIELPPSALTPVAIPTPDALHEQANGKVVISTNMTWRLQLGVFRSAANAERLWKTLSTKTPEFAEMKPILKTEGAFTRLLAGPFASGSDADTICTKLKADKQQCLVLSGS